MRACLSSHSMKHINSPSLSTAASLACHLSQPWQFSVVSTLLSFLAGRAAKGAKSRDLQESPPPYLQPHPDFFPTGEDLVLGTTRGLQHPTQVPAWGPRN